MKILILCNYFQPMNYGENEISRELRTLGHQVTILTGDRFFPFPSYEDTVGKILGPRQQKVGKTTYNTISLIRNKIHFELAARAFFSGVKKGIEELQPDVLLVFGVSTPVAFQAAWFKPKLARLILVDSHLPSELKRGNQFFKYFFYLTFRTLFAPLISRQADKIIAVQEATAELITTTYDIDKQITVISHGTDQNLFKFSDKKRQTIRKKLSIPDTAFTVIYTGKVIEAKGVLLLFQALRQLWDKKYKIELIVVGDGPQQYLQACQNEVPTEYRKFIHWQGWQPQTALPSFYSAADVAVWPLQESLAMNDAASCQLAFIANDQIGVKERLSNNNALTYKQGNVVDLANKIEYLYKNKKLCKEMGQRGRELVEKKMSWRQKAQKYLT